MKFYHSTAFLFCLLVGCKNDNANVDWISKRSNVNIERGSDIEIVYSSGGENRIKAFAKEALRFNVEKPYMTFPNGIKVNFYDAAGNVETVMKANTATVYDGSSMMIAKNNVEVINAKGEKLNTEELIWDESKKMIYSNSYVKISTEDEIILGEGMEANETFTDYTIKKITGVIKVKSGEMP